MVNKTEQSNSDEHNNEQSTETLSDLLVEYRKIADLDVEQAAEILCLTGTTIKSLENEEFENLPEAPYMRGYLRNYARFAGKDPAHIIDVYHQRAGIKKKNEVESAITASTGYNNGNEPTPVITPSRFRLALITVLLLSLILLSMIPSVRDWATKTWDTFSTETAETNTPNSELAPLKGNLPLPINDQAKTTESTGLNSLIETTALANTENNKTTQANGNSSQSENQTDSNRESPKGSDSTTGNQTETANNQASDATDAASDEDKKTKAEGNGDTHLKLVFTDKVWMRIRDAKGKTLYEAVNAAGATKELTLNAPLKFKVGNASHLKLFVDGEEMDISDFTHASVANFGIE